MVEYFKTNIDLDDIAYSGQCFWNTTDKGYMFVAQNEKVECWNTLEGIAVEHSGNFDVAKYFDFETNYRSIKELADFYNDEFLNESIKNFGNIVILRQDLWEMMVTFIISQRKSIPAIHNCVEKLKEKLGEEVNGYHVMPTAERIIDASINDLRSCGVGYRDEYLKSAAEWYLKTPQNKINKYSLMEVHGIGEKVANCIALFGLHDLSCMPKDVWINRIINAVYNGNCPDWMLSEYAGVFQQYVFSNARKLKINER